MARKYTTKEGLKIKRSKAGMGLFTSEPIKKGEFIIEYVGPILSREKSDEKGGKYLFEISSQRTVDGSARTNTARYINHACKPNCEVDIRGGRIFVFAKRKIEAGGELNYDYGKEYFDEHIKPYGCRCDSCSERP